MPTDLSKQQMEELRRIMAITNGEGLLNSLELEEPKDWEREIHEAKSIWTQTPPTGPTQEEKERVANALSAGLDGSTTQTPWNTSNVVSVGQAPGMGRDQVWWDMKRPLVGGMDAWKGLADLANQEGGRYSADNPYVYTDEMREADEAASADHVSNTGYYDAATDSTFWNGMWYPGDLTTSTVTTEDDWSAEDWQWLQEGRYYEGHDQITPQAAEAMRAAGGGSGLIDVFSHDVTPLLDAFKSDDWNPFYGQDRQNIIDRQREIGVLGDRKTAYEKRWDNNVMDYLYENFTEGTDAATRTGVAQKWAQYLAKNDRSHRDYYNRRMTEKMFKDIGLDEYGEFNADYASSGGMLTNPLDGFDMNKPEDAYSADIVQAYVTERDKHRNKKSVASLFDEMKEFDK